MKNIKRAILITIILTSGSVSYTHLDVYKRQQPKGACKAMGKFMEAFRDGANTYMLEHIDEIMAGKESKHGR